MKNAKELLLEFTGFSFKDPEKAAAMFAKDGAFEMPYLTPETFCWGSGDSTNQMAPSKIRRRSLRVSEAFAS